MCQTKVNTHISKHHLFWMCALIFIVFRYYKVFIFLVLSGTKWSKFTSVFMGLHHVSIYLLLILHLNSTVFANANHRFTMLAPQIWNTFSLLIFITLGLCWRRNDGGVGNYLCSVLFSSPIYTGCFFVSCPIQLELTLLFLVRFLWIDQQNQI